MKTKKVNITPPKKGKSISVVGDTYRVLIAGEDTNGDFAAIEMLIPPNGGPGPHSHADFHESFFVVEGEVVVYSEGAKPYTAQKETFINIPKGGIIHSFKNESDKMAKLLCYVAPSGLENFFMEVGKTVEWPEIIPPPKMTPKEAKMLKAQAEKYGQKLFPLDFFTK